MLKCDPHQKPKWPKYRHKPRFLRSNWASTVPVPETPGLFNPTVGPNGITSTGTGTVLSPEHHLFFLENFFRSTKYKISEWPEDLICSCLEWSGKKLPGLKNWGDAEAGTGYCHLATQPLAADQLEADPAGGQPAAHSGAKLVRHWTQSLGWGHRHAVDLAPEANLHIEAGAAAGAAAILARKVGGFVILVAFILFSAGGHRSASPFSWPPQIMLLVLMPVLSVL